MDTLFANYEMHKLIIPHPSRNNLIILLIFVVISLLTLRNSRGKLLDIDQTNQLRGIAILLVITGHLWVHVSAHRGVPVLGDYAVSFFMFLSGYGLFTSYKNRDFKLSVFLKKRLLKLYFPYFIATVLILFLDHFFLIRNYSVFDIILTFAGINISTEIRHLDYARWFITLLLTYYVVFALIKALRVHARVELTFLFLAGAMLILLRLVHLSPFSKTHQIMAFPLGCLVSYHYCGIRNVVMAINKQTFIALLVLCTLVVIVSGYGFLYLDNPYIKLVANNFLVFWFLFAIILALNANSRVGGSVFLGYMGSISYELYLLHGPLLIKYNPILKLMRSEIIVVSYFVWFAVLVLIAVLFHYSLKRISIRI